MLTLALPDGTCSLNDLQDVLNDAKRNGTCIKEALKNPSRSYNVFMQALINKIKVLEIEVTDLKEVNEKHRQSMDRLQVRYELLRKSKLVRNVRQSNVLTLV